MNLHKIYVKNGTAQQVCMRLMVYSDNCENLNWTKMDLMDCSISHCNGASIRWALPAVGETGAITSELTKHCLTSDAKGKIGVAECTAGAEQDEVRLTWSEPSPKILT